MPPNRIYLPILFTLLFFTLSTIAVPIHSLAATKKTSGTIVETMSGSGYTYILVDSDTEKTWVAIPETVVEVGADVSYAPGMVMENFTSKSLNRTFEAIVFSAGLAQDDKATPITLKSNDSFASAVKSEQTRSPKPAQSMASSGGSIGAIVPFQEISVVKAEGSNGYSVEELFAKAKKLDGKNVNIRGIVVKVSANIMGKNWVHIQDGTGNPMQNTHDIVITTSETPELNAEITMEGMVAAEKDFGSGYKYAAIIENAKIIK